MLFKYLPLERIDVLENLRIRFTQLASLNDPFESLPLIDLSEELNEPIDEFIKECDEAWNKLPSEEQNEENLLI